MATNASAEDPQPPIEAIEVAAATWLSLRDRGMSPEETTHFLRWLESDSRHAEIFAELTQTWAEFDRLSALPVATSPAASSPDPELLAPRTRPNRHRGWIWTARGAVAALVLLASLGVSRLGGSRHIAATEVGAYRKVELADGSVAQLNTDSRIVIDFTATARRVRVEHGEVFFDVAKDPSWPFVVSAGPIIVRAVGTAFNVRQRSDAVEVLVTEGSVRVDDGRRGQSALAAPEVQPAANAAEPLLVAGERAVVPLAALPLSAVGTASTLVERVPPVAVQRALAWQDRRLEFDSVPLAEVAHEFNRYNRRQLVIVDAVLATRRFSGSFRPDGYESLVRLLEEDFGVTATRGEREIILRVAR